MTSSPFFGLPSPEDWCVPSYGIYTGCNPEDRLGYFLHNWISVVVNLSTAAILLVAIIITLSCERKKSTSDIVNNDVYIRLAFAFICDPIFKALWCILREVPSSPPWATISMFAIAGGVFTVPSMHRLVSLYMEVMNTSRFELRAFGLYQYKWLWITHSIICVIWFMSLLPLSSLNPTMYAVCDRIFNFGFFLMAIYICGTGVIYGWKIRRIVETEEAKQQVNRTIIVIFAMGAIGSPIIFTRVISPFIIDTVPWMWHIYHFTLEFSICALSLFVFAWRSVQLIRRMSLYSSSSRSSKRLEDSSTSLQVASDIGIEDEEKL
jgi:hypothetical protein